MKLFLCFIFVFYSFQAKAQVFIDSKIAQNMDQFDWSAFSDKETVRSQIEHENEIFKLLGPDSTIIGLNIGKSDLTRVEQELELYRRGIKTGLSPEMIKSSEEAIELHWGSMNDIEGKFKDYAGLGEIEIEVLRVKPMVGSVEDYYKGMRALYEGDHEIVFNMVEKKDEALYKALGEDDEAYAGFIAPYVTRYMEKIGGTAGVYWNSLRSSYAGEKELNNFDVARLIEMYSNSLVIYKCFIKNFKDSEGAHKQELMDSIEGWYANQALLGANSLIETYNVYGEKSNPGAVVMELLGFYEAPDSVKERIGVFLRDDILNNEGYIDTDDRKKLGARTDALIGLNSFGLATPEEQELFNKAIEQGIIEYNNPHNFFGHALPLPEQ